MTKSSSARIDSGQSSSPPARMSTSSPCSSWQPPPAAAAAIRLHVQEAAQILPVDEARQLAPLRGRKFPGVLAQLGRNQREPEPLVHVLFGVTGNQRVSGKQSVLVELEPHAQRPAAEP